MFIWAFGGVRTQKKKKRVNIAENAKYRNKNRGFYSNWTTATALRMAIKYLYKLKTKMGKVKPENSTKF